MLYDCFTFFNELDLLEIRLNYLSEVVDKFVLVEMNKTHSNEDKPFFFEENKKRYKNFADKIIHIKVTEYPDDAILSDPWYLENYQRDCIMDGLKDAKDDDIVMISDLDEIPSLSAIKSYQGGIATLEQKFYYYYLNCLNVSDSIWTKGTKIATFYDLKNPDNENIGGFGAEHTKYGMPTYLRFYYSLPVKNGGWHFSYLGGKENISYKIKSFAHQELNNTEFTDLDAIERRVKAGEDIFCRGYKYEIVPLDESFPEYILKHKKKYKNLILTP